MTQQQLSDELQLAESAPHTILILHVKDAVICQQGRLCGPTLPELSACHDGRLIKHLQKQSLWWAHPRMEREGQRAYGFT